MNTETEKKTTSNINSVHLGKKCKILLNTMSKRERKNEEKKRKGRIHTTKKQPVIINRITNFSHTFSVVCFCELHSFFHPYTNSVNNNRIYET